MINTPAKAICVNGSIPEEAEKRSMMSPPIAIAMLAKGPASATQIISCLGDLSALKFIGTGFAQPSKKEDPEKSTVKDAEGIIQETKMVASSEADGNEKAMTQSGSIDLSNLDDTNFSEDTTEPALETELIETEKQ